MSSKFLTRWKTFDYSAEFLESGRSRRQLWLRSLPGDFIFFKMPESKKIVTHLQITFVDGGLDFPKCDLQALSEERTIIPLFCLNNVFHLASTFSIWMIIIIITIIIIIFIILYCVIFLLLFLLLLKKVGNAKLGESARQPISPNTPAPT